jgi:hypothetical protein
MRKKIRRLNMAVKTLEQRFTDLEHEVKRLQAYVEIQNVMSKLDAWHSTGMEKEAMTLFALTMPDVSAEIADGGVYVGAASIRKIALGVEGFVMERPPGGLGIHCRTSPLIEVAGDCKTAKALWMSPGLETDGAPKYQAYWCWCRYGIDFIKENGQWKIWHLHTYPIFKIPYEKSWTESPANLSGPKRQMPEAMKPDKPTTYMYEYTRELPYENIPAPPEPYETWDGKSMALP